MLWVSPCAALPNLDTYMYLLSIDIPRPVGPTMDPLGQNYIAI